MPQDSGPLNARVGASCLREYPYAVQGPRPRPWRRKALDVGLAACIGGGLALVLLSWSAAPW